MPLRANDRKKEVWTLADSKIRGITLEIGGDTAPLDKALKKSNATANALQKEIKAVDRALKLDPTNTELLTQKQKLLGDAVKGAEAKVKALREAKARADEAMQNGTEVNEKQYRALQREIVTAESNLKSLEKQAEKSGGAISASLKQAGNKLVDVGGKIKGAGKSLLPLTGAIVGAGTAAVAAMDNVDEGLDTVMKKTGATGEAAKELDAVFRGVAAKIPGDFGDIGAAVGEVNTRLGFTGDKLRTASEDFLKFAKVNDTDVNSSVQLVTRAMGDANIAADDYAGVLDALTVAGQVSGISIDSLATNLAKYGAPMRALGIDTKQSIAMFAGWEKAGVNTETAFSGMKTAISTWGAAGKDSTTEFQKTIDAIKAAPDIAAATSMAIETFGRRAGPDLADAIRGGRFEFDEYTKALEASGGAVESTYGMVVDEADDAALAMQNIQLAMHDVGETIAKTLGPVLLDLANWVKGVFEWFGNLDEGTQKLVLTIAGIAAAAGPVLMAIGQITTGAGVLLKGLSKLPGVVTAIGGAAKAVVTFLMANPIVAIIGAVVAAVIYLWNNCEWFRDAVIAIWEKVKEVVGGVVDALVTFFTVTIPEAWNSVLAFFQGIPEFFAQLWNNIKQFFIDGWNSIVAFFTQTIPAFIASIGAWFQKLPYNIGLALGTAVKKVAEWGTNLLNWVKTTLPQIISNIVNWFAQLPGRIWAWLVQTIQKVAAWGAQTLETARTAAENTLSSIVAFFAQLPGKVWTWLSETVQKVIAWGAEMASTAAAKMAEFGENVLTTLRELPGKVLTIGENIVKGIWEGIKNAAGWLWNKITGWCGDLMQGFKDALGIKSPSRAFRDQVGKNIILGVAKGIDENAPAAVKKAKQVSQDILSAAVEWVDDKKFFNEMSLADELAFWEDLKTMHEIQGDELHEIDKKIYTTKQTLLQEQQAAEQEAMDAQQAALEEYQRNLQARADSIKGFAGIFDEVSRESEVTGKNLLKNLRGQVDAIEDWQGALDELAAKGMSTDVIAELREQGPKAINEIEALTELKDDEIAEYSEIYAKKTMLAAQQALDEMGGLTIPLTSIADAATTLGQNAAYATIPAAQIAPQPSTADREKAIVAMVGEALLAGLTMIGDSIFDAIPKQVDFNVDSTRFARATWDAYDVEGDRRRRYYAPTRDDIAAIAMSVMPKPLKG